MTRRNPVPPSSRATGKLTSAQKSAVARAADLYQRFSGHDAEAIGKIRVPQVPRVGVAIGEVAFIGYDTVRDGVYEKYIHKFHKKDCPLLVVSPDGKSLMLVGGNFTFTERGIVDRSDK